MANPSIVPVSDRSWGTERSVGVGLGVVSAVRVLRRPWDGVGLSEAAVQIEGL